MAAYSASDPSLEKAAYTLGAPPWSTLWRVTLPLLRPALFAGGMFAFLISFDEVAISLLPANAHSITLPVSILSYLAYNYDPAVAAISVIKMAFVVVAGIFSRPRLRSQTNRVETQSDPECGGGCKSYGFENAAASQKLLASTHPMWSLAKIHFVLRLVSCTHGDVHFKPPKPGRRCL